MDVWHVFFFTFYFSYLLLELEISAFGSERTDLFVWEASGARRSLRNYWMEFLLYIKEHRSA